MKCLYLLIILFLTTLTHAIEKYCQFEEVYSNGDVQLGFLLIKDEKIRYEYSNQNLYTIIHQAENSFVIQNDNKQIVQKISQDTRVIDSLIEILSQYPNIKEHYYFEDLSIKIEKNRTNFIKRLGIQSNNLNLSINLIDCEDYTIDNIYFNHFNLTQFKKLN